MIPPGTGVGRFLDTTSGKTFDTNWYIIGDSINTEPQDPYFSTAVIVSSLGGNWASQSGPPWVGPAVDQSNATRPGTCCAGTVTYQLQFNVNSLSENFVMSVLADDTVTGTFNGNPITFSTPPSYLSPGTVTFSKGFLNGTNTLNLTVTNVSGPTGLNVSFSAGSTIIPTTLGPSTAKAVYSIDGLPDPVDSATGQYYETDSEIELGGPMNLGFRRYYSSQLANGKVSTALGPDWMSTYDVMAAISGTARKCSCSEARSLASPIPAVLGNLRAHRYLLSVHRQRRKLPVSGPAEKMDLHVYRRRSADLDRGPQR